MSRAISIALNTFEVHGFELPRFQRLRSALARVGQVDAAATAVYSENQAIRNSSRGWMI